MDETEKQAYRDAAIARHGDDGNIEIDQDAEISRGDDGCYVQAWVYVPKEDVESDED